jgi:hypothetical protein
MRTEIPQREWSRQLDEFSRMHQGWLVSLEIVSRSLGVQSEFHQLPLVGVTAELAKRNMISISVAEPTGGHLTHLIYSPTQLSIEKTDVGADAALNIESADGTKASLRFRTPALPETVDGIVGKM